MTAALTNAALVGCGGFLGALLRYGMSGLVQRQVPLSTFPYGTLAVNLLGCLLIGAVVGLGDSRQLFGPETRTFLLIGLLGSFTTFSTFGYETFALLRDGENLQAAAYVGLHLVLGPAVVWLAYALARWEGGGA